jgi:RNA polymerase sigma factor (sigma-70 family)
MSSVTVKEMHDDPLVIDLVTRARNGDKLAWEQIVERYAPLIWSICRKYRLGGADAEDVGQVVWLHLVDQLDNLRDPAALPGWLATTTRHECERYLRINGRSVAMDPITMGLAERADGPEVDEVLLAAERRQALIEGLAELAPQHRELLRMLTADPPYPYAEISRALGIPIGSIGPTRSRVLDKLRETGAVRAYLGTDRSAQLRGCP